MKQVGIVETANGTEAVVSVRRASACGENCAMCKGGCAPTRHEARVENGIGAAKGNLVQIETADSAVLKSAFLVYLMPIAVLFLCYGIAFAILPSRALATAAALIGFCASFFLLRALDKKTAPLPKITKILNEREADSERESL